MSRPLLSMTLTANSSQNSTRRSLEATEKTAATVTHSTDLANQSGVALNEIVSIVRGTSGQVSSIATASEQQSAASEEISSAIDDITRICCETSGGMDQSSPAVTELAQQAQELNRIIENLRN